MTKVPCCPASVPFQEYRTLISATAELFRLELIKAGGFNAFMACVLRWREDDDMSLRALCLLDMLAVQVDSLEPEQIANLVDVADQCLQKPGLAFTYQIIDLLSKAVEADSVCDCIVERCNLQLLSKCIDLNYQQAHDPDLQKAALGIIMAVASKAERRAQMPLWFMRVIETGLTRHVSESTITIWLQFLGLMVKESNLMRVQQLDLVIYVIKILKTLAEQQLVQEPDFSKANKQQVLKFLEKRDLNVIKNAAIKLLSSAAPEIAAQAAIDIPADLCEKISVALAPCFQDAADCRHRMASLGATGHVVGCLSSYNMTVIEHALKAISFFAADGSFTELLLSHNLLKGLSVVLNNNTEIVSRNARMVLGHLQRLGGDRVQVEIDMLLKGNPWDVIYAQWNRDR
nr:hypothetical protein HK105_004763 [Polyrhizophydium stewartii]